MKVGEIFTMYEFVSRIQLEDGDAKMSNPLKEKIITFRLSLSKEKRKYDEDFTNHAKNVITEELVTLRDKTDKTEDEQNRFDELYKEYSDDCKAYVTSRIAEDSDVEVIKFSQDEFKEIISTNLNNNVIIGEQKLSASDFIEALNVLFV